MNVMFSLPLVAGGPAYTCVQIARALATPALRTRLFAPLDRRAGAQIREQVETGLPRAFARLPFALSRHVAQPRIERRFANRCRREGGSSIAYLWGETSLALARRLHRQGTLVVREKINSGKQVSGELLRAAYARLGALDAFDDANYRPARLDKEKAELELADYIYCPSPMVRDTLRTIGLPDTKLIPTSYGYEPARLDGDTRALARIDGPTFLFTGYICVRKGAHTLLDAWQRSGVRGRLILLGRIEPLIAERFAAVLARADVEHHAFTSDVGAYYRSADYFIFPSLEEGGPQVTYEAASLGLPSIVTPGGAGAIVRDGVDGDVIRSDDPAIWAAHLAGLDRGSERYAAQSAAARARAREFTWERVGAQRREALLERWRGDARSS